MDLFVQKVRAGLGRGNIKENTMNQNKEVQSFERDVRKFGLFFFFFWCWVNPTNLALDFVLASF